MTKRATNFFTPENKFTAGGVAFLRRADADLFHLRVGQAEALGLKVGPWGLSRGDDIRRMRDLGVYSSTVSGADWGL